MANKPNGKIKGIKQVYAAILGANCDKQTGY